jgi:hypothetical protein
VAFGSRGASRWIVGASTAAQRTSADPNRFGLLRHAPQPLDLVSKRARGARSFS